MQAMKPFFSDDADGWMRVIGFLLTTTVVVYGAIRSRLKWESSLRSDIDGVGGRVRDLETSDVTKAAEIRQLQQQTRDLEQQHRYALERIAAVEKAQETISKMIQVGTEQMAVEARGIKAALDREQQMVRERIVRLETINDIRRLQEDTP